MDYLINVKNYSFPDAVETILGRVAEKPPPFYAAEWKQVETTFSLPERNESSDKVVAYLLRRGIDSEIIDYCIKNDFLYETKQYHDAAFVGYDREGTPRCVSLRAIRKNFKSEVGGSDKRYSFSIPGKTDSTTVHLFESAIDALSYATLLKMTGREWRKDTLLSLGGVYLSLRGFRLPLALRHYLSDHPGTKTLLLHLDNDEVGRGAASGIISMLGDKYRVIDSPAPTGKDVNDYLIQRIERHRKKEEHERC